MASDETIERELRNQVAKLMKTDPDNVTVKRVRARAEEELDLENGFLKSDAWKERSKTIVQEAFDDDANEGPSPHETSGQKPPVEAYDHEVKTSKKRKSPEGGGKPSKRSKKQSVDQLSEDAATFDTTTKITRNEGTGDDLLRDSELSDVIEDEKPPARTRKSKSMSAAPGDGLQGKTKAKKAGKKTAATELGPDELEIKKLQEQLVKCGTRKLWGKELKPFETTKEKIKHLKSLLRNVGMDGRFSEEKAKRIKEEREFKADLDEIKEGNKAWGRNREEEEDAEQDGGEGGRPQRKLAKGLAELDEFQDEESD